MTFIDDAGHPALSRGLVHLCGRARQQLPSDIAAMLPQDRLNAILRDEVIKGFRPYGSWDPVVSFSEMKTDGLAYLIKEKQWAPWGLVLKRDAVYAEGGGPVWYARGGLWDQIPSEIKTWAVRLEPGKAEWLHEREWRIPADSLRLTPQMVQAVIVGDPDWHPAPVLDIGIDEVTGATGVVECRPRLLHKMKRWYWNSVDGQFEQISAW